MLGVYDFASIRSLTQEDPLGLAGGLNLYGFASGDPVNFSDPFGLCDDPSDPKCKTLAQKATEAMEAKFQDIADRTISALGSIGNGLKAAGKFLLHEIPAQIAVGLATEGVGYAAEGGRLAFLFKEGNLAGKSVDAVRGLLRGAGLEAGAVESGAGELYRLPGTTANVRIMFREAGPVLRIQNEFGNYLNSLGRVARDAAEGHIPLAP